MHSPAVTLATRGILNNKGVVLPTSGYLILSIEVQPVPLPELIISGGGGGPGPTVIKHTELKKKYYIKVKFQIEDKVYTDIKYIDKEIKVSADNISIEIVDNKPKVIISFMDEKY